MLLLLLHKFWLEKGELLHCGSHLSA